MPIKVREGVHGMEEDKGVPTKVEIPQDVNTQLKMIGLREKKTKNHVMLEAFDFYIAHKEDGHAKP